jgi:alpha-L-rhamnosidase
MWERWDSMLPDGHINPGEMTSFNHYALGSVGAWLHSSVGGISQSKDGWKEVLFAPVPGGTVTWARVRHLSSYGVVGCEWKIEGGRFWMGIEVPPNSRGVVRVPGQKGETRVGSGRWEFEGVWEEKEWPPKAILSPYAMYSNGDE